MGQRNSVAELKESGRLTQIVHKLSSVERRHLSNILKGCTSAQVSSVDFAVFTRFLKEQGVPDKWVSRIISLANQTISKDNVSDQSFSCFLAIGAIFVADDAHCLSEFLRLFLSEEYSHKKSERKKVDITKDLLAKFLTEVIDLYVAVVSNSLEYKRWHFCEPYSSMAVIKFLLTDLKNPSIIRLKHVNAWMSNNKFIRSVINTCFRRVFRLPLKRSLVSAFPVVSGTTRLSSSSIIFDAMSLAFVTSQLPADLHGEFRLTYSNKIHNYSFFELVKRLKTIGPAVIIIKDKKSSVFGAFTKDSWVEKAFFYGSKDCFLFSLYPEAAVYRNSGINSNFMYLEPNEQATYNGLGIGGQIGRFGLFIDGEDTFGYGTSLPCTTFNSPQLSLSQRFRIDSVEIWSIVIDPFLEKSIHSENDLARHSSILDKDPGALRILSLTECDSHVTKFRRNTISSIQPLCSSPSLRFTRHVY